MNFPGKFDSAISGAQPTASVDVDTFKHHNHDDKSGSITIADAQLLFNGDYKRSGVDLILSKDGHQQVVANYFKGEHRASLASPDGSHLTGEIVSALAGNVEYAQATNPADVGKVIGHVTKIVGNATAIRNGVSIILNNGDNVEKGDVVQAGSDSQLSVTFIDGTVFGLSSNARMVLNEMVYDPNGSSNSSLLTLVAGTISFVAGETAKHGDMKVDTPTAVLGIRGTAVLVEIDFTVPASGTTPAVTFQVLAEPDGHTGSYILYSKPTATNPTPVEIGRVDQAGLSYAVTANNQVASTTAPPLPPEVAAVVIETFVEKFNAPPPQVPAPAPDKTAPTNANPNSTSGGGGSSTPPPPATPLDTSPIDNHNTQPTDQTPIPTPISTTPTPSGTGTTTPITTPTTIVAAGGAIVTITVTPAADTPSFTIPQHVTTPSTPPATFVAFVPGSGTVPSVSTNGTPPPGVDLTKLISVNESTGAVSYNPADFAFLKQGQSAVATIAFQSNDGTENVPEALTLTIDGQAPVPPVVTVSNPGIIITNSATQTISGTVAAGLAAAGATVTLLDTVNGVTQQIGTATVASDGTWATQVTLQGDGTHSIVAQDTDAVGNVGASAPVVVTLDTIPPTVTITTAGNISNVATHTISGIVIAGDAAIGTTVELLDTVLDPATQLNVTKLIGTATVGPGGTWTTSVTLSGDGDHTIVATDIDAAGGVGASSPVVFTLSTTLPPTVTIATAPETSNSASQTISGHVSQGESPIGTTVALYDTFNGVTSQIGSATVDGNGGWTTQVTLSGDGAHNIVAQDIDIAGNLGASDPVVFTLDTLPPTVLINTAGITTNHSLQAISGSVTAGEAAVGSTVTLLDNGDVIETATVGSGGLWTTNVTLSGDGVHNIVAQDTDAAGNVGNSAPIAFTLDTVAPTVKISTTGATTNQAQQTISGSVTTTEAAAGSTVTLFDNGNAIGTASLSSGGAWTTAVTLSGDGVHNITAQDIDAVGNVGTSTPVVFTLDTVSPTVTIGTTGTTTNQATQTISGTVTTTEAAAGGTVTLLDTVNGVTTQIGTATVSGGSWTTSVTLSGNGANSIVAQDTDIAGNTGNSSATVFTLATVAPTIAITGPVAGDNIVNKAEAAAGVTIGGTAAAGIGGAAVNGQIATITIVDSTNAVKDTLTTTVSGGAWSVSLTPAQAQGLADGSYTIKANVSDAAGNAAITATQAITVDETAPTIAITGPVAGDNIVNKAEAAAGVTIGGTAAAGVGGAAVNGQTATITIVDSTNAVKDTLTTTVSGGAWSVSLTPAQAQGLADGSYTIKANVSDTAGNAAITATQAITVDETAPTIAITGPVAGDNIVNKAEAAAGVTIGGTAAAGVGGAAVNGQTATITIVDSTNAVKDTLTTTVSGGAWSVSLTPAQAQGLADGSYTIKANVSDTAGNAATTATQVITLDETAPTITITSPVAGDNIVNKAEAAAGITISGTAASTVNGQTATITIVDATNAVKDTLTTTVSGSAWSVSLTAAQAQGLTDGSYTIKANVTDAAGNAATTATQAISVDTLAPTVTIGTPGTTTNQATQTISGTVTTTEAAAGGTVTLLDTVNGVTTQIGTATVSGGSWTTSVTLSGNGANSIVAQDTDIAGNTGNSSATVFTLATVAPTIAITGPVAGDNIVNKAEAAAGVTIGGTAAAGIGGAAVNGQIATITIVDSTNAVKDTLTTTVSGGAWSVSLTPAQAQGLADGSYTIKANVSDTAGNAATTATQAITVDETAPTIAITGPVAGDNIVNKAEAAAGVTIGGTAAAGVGGAAVNGQTATITIVDATNAVKDTLTTTVSGGAWSVSLTPAQAQGLADGSYTIKANVSDTAGNAATTATQVITLDETAPTITITSPVAGDNIINKTEATAGVTISGTVAAGPDSTVNGQIATITIVDSTNAVKDTLTTTVSGGAWSVSLTPAQAQGLTDGSYTIKANVSDTAGNAATTATQVITLDETAPTITITSPVAGDNIINKAEAAAGVTISGTAASTVNGQIATITIVDATNAVKDTLTTTVSGGAWSVSLTPAQAQGLTDGSYTIKANVTDAAGNAATTATQVITVDETAPTIAITSPVAGDNIVNKAEAAAGVTISGTVAAGPDSTVNGQTATITIVDATNAVKDTLTTTVSGSAWSVNLSAAQAQGLTDGSYTIKANVTDAAGNAATTATQAISVDTLAPTVTIGTPGTTTNQATQTISGTVTTTEAAAGGTVTLLDTVNGVTTQIGTATVSGGSWTTSVTLSGNGANSIVAQDTDIAGNTGNSSATVFTLATVAPTIAITGPVAGDNIVNKAEAAAGVTIGGTAAAGIGGAAVNGQIATITIVDSTNAVKDTLTTTVSGGAWSVSLTPAQAQGLADGSYTIKANVSDAAGNAAITATQAITVDETAPTIAITSPVAGDNIVNKAEAAAGVTIGGTAAAGIGGAAVNGQTATITIVDATNAVKDTLTTTVSGGAWSVSLTPAQAQGLADGSYTIKANVSDTAGNAATTATQAITVDETAPTIAITSPVAGDNIVNKAEAAAGVTISGTVAAGPDSTVNGQIATITIVDSTNAVKDILTTTVSGGAWSVSLTPAQAQGLTDGSYTIKANVSDTAGNAATTATQVITLDETAPTITITSPVAGDNIINKAEAAAGVTISGTAASTVNGQIATITIVDATNAVKDTLTTTVSGSAWSVSLTAAQAQGLTDGSYTIKANVTDAAGNAATTATQAISVDTLAPTVTIGTPGTTTNQATQTISGTVTTTEAAAGGTVTLLDTFNGTTTQIGTATLSGGAWSTTVTLSGSGTHSIVAEDTDAGGNTGSSRPVVYSLSLVANSWANPSGGNWTVGANWSSGTVPSNTANVAINPIGATAPYSVSILSGTTILANSLALSDPFATLLDAGVLSIAASLLMTAGSLEIENGGTLSLGGSSAFTTTFAGTGGNLVLGNSPGFTGTINAVSIADGAVSITGSGNITTTSGDGMDLTASQGTQTNPSNLTLGLTGTILGAANGVNVVQNGIGDITIGLSGNVKGLAGDGLIAEQSSSGNGNVTVSITGSLTGTGTGTYGLLAEILNASDTGNVSIELAGSIAGAGQYGIRALSNGTGDITVMTDPGSSVNSSGTGISAINKDPAILAPADSTITVTAYGTINSGAVNNLNGSVPKGIDAGYYGASGTTNTAINGTVIIYNYANVTSAGGDGIEGYNEGNGNVTVDDEAGTTVSAALYGITAYESGIGNINVTTSGSDTINSGSVGINVYNQAASIPQSSGITTSTITVTTALGTTINSGFLLTGGSSRPAGILAGYKGGTTNTTNSLVYGNVVVNDSANINAAGGDGIRAYNYGSGNVTVNDLAGSIKTNDQYGIDAASYGSGQVAVTTAAGDNITAGSYGIQAINLATSILSTALSSVTVVAYGTINAGFHLSTGAGENQGISAGYYPNNGTSDTSVNGTVSIDNFANVTSETGYGINAYNWGNGSVTLTDEAGTSVSGGQYGLDGFSGSIGTGSSGSVAINVGSLTAPVGTITSITAGSAINADGINANDRNGGTIAITMYDNGDKINSGGFGINAGNQSTSATASSNITITARGTINSGFSGFMPAGINAGYNGGSGTVNANVDGNVFVYDYAAINAASGFGISLYNYGGGNLTATVEAGATVVGAAAGVNATAQGGGLVSGGGNVTITNNGTVTDATGTGINTGTGTGSTGTGLPSNATGTGTILITNTGTITALGASNSAVVQINNFSANMATFNNSGTVTANMLSSGLSVAISLYSGTATPTDTGGITINNNAGGTISGDLALWPSTFLVSNSTFNNASGAIWNVNGTNGFGSATSAINNSGIINIAGTSEFYAGSTGSVNATLTFNNSGTVNVLAGGYGFIGGAVGTTQANGTFSIGDRAALEFNSSVSSQTVSFADGKGVLTLDNPAAFSGTISGLTFGDTLDLMGGVIAPSSVSISSTALRVNTTLSYNVTNVQPGASLDVLSGNQIIVVPTTSLAAPFTVTGLIASYTNSSPSPTTYIFANDAISGSGTGIVFAAASDSNTADTVAVIVNQSSTVSVSGNSINVTTGGANIAIVDAASVTSGATGINANSGSWNAASGAGNGSVDIMDYGNVSGQVGILAGVSGGTGGQGQLNVVVGPGAIVAGSVSSPTSTGIIALSGQGSSRVTTSPGTTINSGGSGIIAENQATSVPLLNGARTSIVVTTSGAINSGQGGTTATTGAPAGIVVGYLGNSTGQTSVPNPPLTGIFGNVAVSNNAIITATSGSGIVAFDYGTGDISVSNSSTITANHLGTVAGSTALGFTQYGISAYNYGIGNVSVTSTGSIAAGGTGISAGNQATAIPADAQGNALSTVTVDSLGSVSSGANLNGNGSAPAAILVGYNPGLAGAPANVSSITTTGNVVVIAGGNVTAAAGEGIDAYNYGNGNVTVSVGYNVVITAEFSATAANGGNSPFGIGAFSWGIGNIAVTTSNSDTINSGSTGINAVNLSNAITPAPVTLVTVNSFGSINFGGISTNTGGTPAGVSAGYLGGNAATANMDVDGTVIVNNSANITPTVFNGVAAAGIGINAFSYGNGDITVNDNSGTTVSGVQYGIEAHAEGGTGTNAPTGNLSVNLAANAIVNATTSYGILAFSTDVGDISIVTSSGDIITGGSAGINAVNEQANIGAPAIGAPDNSWISVTAAGTINSGAALTGTGKEPAGILAGYLGGSVIPTSLPINVYGEVVVNNSATINAAGGDGIRAYNYGIGNITVNEYSGTITALDASDLTPAGYGIGIAANNYGSGNTTIDMTAGIINSGGSGIAAINQAVSDAALPSVPSNTFVTVLAYGTIISGSITTNTNTTVKDPAAGILAGYDPNNADIPDNNIHGTVVIDDYASISAAAGTDGIRGVNYGDGTITIIAEAGAVISAGEYGIAAVGGDGGDISITTSATLTGGAAAIHTTTSSPAETVTIENLGHMTGLVLTENAAFDNGAGGEWDLAGASTFASGTNTLTNEGVIDSTGTASITVTTGTLGVTNAGTVNVQSGTLDIGGSVTGTGQFTIGSGDQLEFGGSVASGQTVTFEGSTGTLKLDDPTDFHGQISGLTGSDGINLAGFDSTTVVSANIEATETILTVTDDNHTGPQNDAVITLLGNYNGSSFNFSNVQGGVLIVDPPATAPAMITVTATAANQTLTGTGTADNFAFNFANVGQATITNFHADTDVVEVKAPLFANLQAILDATHDDADGNAVVTLDSHDSITLTGVAKAQLHPTDFHLV